MIVHKMMTGVARIYRPLMAAFVVAVTGITLSPALTSAQSVQEGVQAARGNGTPDNLFGGLSGDNIVGTIVSILLFIVGALAVIMIIIGGLRYVISGGDDKKIGSAKNTVLYAIIGLVVALLAYAAVNFVLEFIANGGSGSGL